MRGLALIIREYLDQLIKAIIYSGAQFCLWGLADCLADGFSQSDLIPVRQKLNAVSLMCIIIIIIIIISFIHRNT